MANLIVDMMLFKMEIKEYLRGNHPQADQLEEVLPPDTMYAFSSFFFTLTHEGMVSRILLFYFTLS